MKKDIVEFLCVECRSAARNLRWGDRLRCDHNGATITVDHQGQRTVRFVEGRGPKFTTEGESTLRASDV